MHVILQVFLAFQMVSQLYNSRNICVIPVKRVFPTWRHFALRGIVDNYLRLFIVQEFQKLSHVLVKVEPLEPEPLKVPVFLIREKYVFFLIPSPYAYVYDGAVRV